jgi:PAS domain S-box-containing protein
MAQNPDLGTAMPLGSAPLRYGVALGSVAVALSLSLLARPLIESNPFLLFFAAVALSSWWGGMGPGVVATILAALISDYVFLPPAYALSLDLTTLARLSGFMLVAFLISLLSEARIRAQVRLRASEARTRATVDAALDGIITIDATGQVVEFNPAAEEIFGYRRAEVVERPLADLIVPTALRDEHRRGLAQCVATGDGPLLGRRIELTALRADGSEFPLELALTRINTDGQLLFTGFVRDLTAHKRAEETRAFLAAIVESSDDAIIGKNLDGTILSWNAGAELLYGYSAAEVAGQPICILVPHDRVDEVAQILAHIKQGERIAHYETVRVRKDGTRIEVDLTISPIKDAAGMITGASTVARDITERKRLEAQLLQAQKMESVGRLAGGIAHDFNNLLTAISGYTDLAHAALPADHPVRSDLDEIQKAARRAATLTRQLLAFARKQPIEPHILNLNDLLREMDKLLRRVIGENIDLVTQPAADLGQVIADPGQIEQVLINLAVNARDAMAEGGKLTIETHNVRLDAAYSRGHVSVTEGPYVLLAVSDTGAGMDAEVQSHMFEPFFTTKEYDKGTGLGLATCYGIIKQHGGFIWVYSEVGHGTSIKIYLPRVYEAAETLSQLEEQVAPRGTETVLLVEDELAVRVFAARVLREAGYTVVEASQGDEALRLAQDYPGAIALLVTDVVLPQLGGKALAERLVAQSPSSKVLFISGYADDAIVRHGRLEAGLAFLHKPFSPTALLRKVRAVLDTS